MNVRDLLRLRGSHEATRVYHSARRRGCRVAARGARAATASPLIGAAGGYQEVQNR
jgi:hypothetical protein